MEKIIKNLICKMGFHFWEYETYTGRRRRIHRFCSNCSKTQNRVQWSPENAGYWVDVRRPYVKNEQNRKKLLGE